jgi:phosphomethylpyrimidine synthase
MKITRDVRDYAESYRIEDIEIAVEEGVKEKSAEFLKEGGQIYREV